MSFQQCSTDCCFQVPFVPGVKALLISVWRRGSEWVSCPCSVPAFLLLNSAPRGCVLDFFHQSFTWAHSRAPVEIMLEDADSTIFSSHWFHTVLPAHPPLLSIYNSSNGMLPSASVQVNIEPSFTGRIFSHRFCTVWLLCDLFPSMSF